ncbi:MAG: hypothetical protein K8S24_04130 [Candidatus Aegiribacteria sp.]|nr:hypothetical protein [Candidatus Aegiribacteria sp.]
MACDDIFRAAVARQFDIWAGRFGTAVLAMASRLSIPVKYIGVGEGSEDLLDFELESYVRALLGMDEADG